MATSSTILQSFLRDALKDKRKLADLSFEELLSYNRDECGFIKVDFQPETFADLKELTKGHNAIVLYHDTLYYGDKDRGVRELEEPVAPEEPKEPEQPEESAKSEKTTKKRTDPQYLKYLENYAQYKIEYSKYIEQRNNYNELKKACSETYKRARGKKLDWVRSLTGRAFAEHRSDDFLLSLDFYLGILGTTDRVMFDYMNDNQKEELAFNLKITLLLLLAQQKHEIDNQKTENVKVYNQHIKRCSDFLRDLDPEYQARIKEYKAQQELSDGIPVKYLGIPLGQLLARDMVDLSGGTTKTIKKNMGALNEKRLYWVWGSTFLKTVIDLVPQDYLYAAQAPEAIRTPDPYTGSLSWILYYARFFMELGLLLKHTIRGPWMGDEINTPWEERFLTQFSQRKFALLNDSLWATANLVCFFWLTGKGALGAAGDAVTLVLLVFDIVMAIWELEEKRIKYNKAMQQYEEDSERLAKQLEAFQEIEKSRQLRDDESREKRQIEVQIRTLARERSKCERDWQLEKVSLINNIAYAVGLMLAFVVLTMPFMPVAAPVLATMAIVGAVLCLAFTMINNAIKGGIELYKTHKTIQEEQKESNQKVRELIALLKKNSELDANERKLLYLEIRQCQAETEYQKQVMKYQSANLVRSIMIEALVPAVVFASLVFVPLGIGVPVLIAAVALAIATHYLVEAWFKPDEKKALEFDDKQYAAFCDEILEAESPAETTPGFFKKNEGSKEGRDISKKKNNERSKDFPNGVVFE